MNSYDWDLFQWPLLHAFILIRETLIILGHRAICFQGQKAKPVMRLFNEPNHHPFLFQKTITCSFPKTKGRSKSVMRESLAQGSQTLRLKVGPGTA